jgi:hypothetical protein
MYHGIASSLHKQPSTSLPGRSEPAIALRFRNFFLDIEVIEVLSLCFL